jgi:transposase
MLSLAHNTRIYVYRPAADLRKSFDGLTGLVRSAFRADPRDGSWFLFFNKRRDRLKILAWEPDGFSIWYKRLEAGSFETLRGANADVANADSLELDVTELTLLLSGVSLTTARRRKRFAASA